MRVRPIATLRMRGAARMSSLQRRKIAAWITKLAADLLNEGDQYSEHFAARYFADDTTYRTRVVAGEDMEEWRI